MLELIQEVLFYIEDQFEYVQVQDLCRPDDEKRFASLHKKITSFIVSQLKSLPDNKDDDMNHDIERPSGNDALLPSKDNMMIDAENTKWLVKFKSHTSSPQYFAEENDSSSNYSDYEDRVKEVDQTEDQTPDVSDTSESGDDVDDSTSVNENTCSNSIAMPYLCTRCNVKFATEEAAKKHMRTHIEEAARNKTYSCQACGMRFTNKVLFDTHTHPTDDEKPYKCDVCSTRFARKLYLDKHKLMHENSDVNYKFFRCVQCDKSFSQKRHLNQHVTKAHVKRAIALNSFKCMECKKSFSKKNNLHRHIKTVHSKTMTPDEAKPFKCEYCDHRVKFPSHLKDHILIHTMEKPYSCSLCDAKYNRNYLLKNHIAKCH